MWKKWFSKDQTNQLNQVLIEQLDPNRIPKHVAIIMDGNGRWAQKKGFPRVYGHRNGAATLKKIVRVASDLGVKVLTAYAFSTENWKRPTDEVQFIMELFSHYLDNEIDEMHQNRVKIRFIGNIDRLDSSLQKKIEHAQNLTQFNQGLILNLAVNYGGRAELTDAVRKIAEKIKQGELDVADIDEDTITENLYTCNLPDPDLLIRPSGDLRISNFLLWQIAYSEFWFTEVNWPDFTPDLFMQAIYEYQQRDRRFGGVKK